MLLHGQHIIRQYQLANVSKLLNSHPYLLINFSVMCTRTVCNKFMTQGIMGLNESCRTSIPPHAPADPFICFIANQSNHVVVALIR